MKISTEQDKARLAELRAKIVQVPGEHWTRVPENQAIVSEMRQIGMRTRKRNKARKAAAEARAEGAETKAPVKPHKPRPRRPSELARARAKELAKLNQEMIDNGTLEEIQHGLSPEEQEAARIAFTHCETWVSLYAKLHGLSQSTITRWVGQALVRESRR